MSLRTLASRESGPRSSGTAAAIGLRVTARPRARGTAKWLGSGELPGYSAVDRREMCFPGRGELALFASLPRSDFELDLDRGSVLGGPPRPPCRRLRRRRHE